MAGLARTARPWLLSLRRPPAATPYHNLGLGLSISSIRGISATTTRGARTPTNKELNALKTQRKREKENQNNAMVGLLLPFTIVPPPLSRFPRSPVKFAQMVWAIAKNRAQVLGSLVALYAMSMPKGRVIGLPRFKARKRACVPAAKSLHVQMSEAVAAGDKDTLRRVCVSELFVTLAGAIDSRPPRLRTEWELVRYDNPLRYPRIADFRVLQQPYGGHLRIIKQAVVSISSVQRLTRYYETPGGELTPVPGTGRERHMVEHIVLHAIVDENTYETGPWKLWGTLPEMSYERIRDDEVLIQEAMARNTKL
ncbi:hypothetical protein F4859DRAFT_266541 [Xylaria cf. heliscus]|nr:hypothetical protein F4859DRAFT_266541 [Xylaria cf. heliscus]